MTKETKVYNFGEKAREKVKDGDKWVELDVWPSPKFLQSKEKAISLIEEKKYDLDEGDFWILMNKGGSKMVYSGLIISHNGCLKINDKLDAKMQFKPSAVSFLKDSGGDKVMQYACDEQGIYEFGEIAPSNCKNQYPYAMVLKRLMDRVILKTSKIGFHGIYSENENDEFKNKNEEPEVRKEEDKTPIQKVADGVDEAEAEVIFDWLSAEIQKCNTPLELAHLKTTKDFKQSCSKLKRISEEKLSAIGMIGTIKESNLIEKSKKEAMDDSVNDLYV